MWSHRVRSCDLLWVQCTRLGWVLSSTPSQQHRSACPECNHKGPPQSHSIPGGGRTFLQQEKCHNSDQLAWLLVFVFLFFLRCCPHPIKSLSYARVLAVDPPTLWLVPKKKKSPPGINVTCRQLTVSQTHGDVIKSNRAAVQQTSACADKNNLSGKGTF